MSQQNTSFNPMYFPPPPTTATTSNSAAKKNIKLTFSKPRPSTDTISMHSQPKPILKSNTLSKPRVRQWILLSLLVLSFTILILSVIFAYCAALPHSDNLDAAQSTPDLPTGNTPTTTSTVTLLDTATSTLTAARYRATNVSRDAPKDTDVAHSQQTQDAREPDAATQASFSTSSALASLTLYTALLPLLTLLHTSTELLASLVRPEASQNTRLGDMLRFRRVTPSGAAVRRRTGTLLSFAVSTMLVLGWLTTQMFWIDCEIQSFGRGGDGVCPVQIRGHRMGGVSELSIGKVVLGFVVLLVYVAYACYLVRVVGVFRKTHEVVARGVVGSRRKARFARGNEDVESVDVVIAIEEKEMK